MDAIKRIQRYIADVDEASYLESELIQDAVIRHLEIIGDASRNINRHFPKYAEHHSNVPFSIAYEIRNVLAHEYFKIDHEMVWETIERDLPEFEIMIAALLNHSRL